jgi:hypothetical protein
MNNVPPKVRKELSADPEYKRCALLGYHACGGRITWEHAFIFAGKQIQERWAIIPVCAAGQEVDEYQDAGTMDKDMNKWAALNRASDIDLARYSKAINLFREKERLNNIYGKYVPPPIPRFTEIFSGINY